MNIIIVGAGKFGSLLASQLCQENHSVTVIDKNQARIESLIQELDIQVVCGNGANYEILLTAECNKADVLIAATSLDEVNILSCLFAKKLGAKETIARVRDPEYSKQGSLINKELGISMIINPELETANEITRMLKFPSALKVETVANGKVDLLEMKLEANSPFNNCKLSYIHTKYKLTILVFAVKRNDKVYIPNGDFELKSGDIIYITADDNQVLKLFSVLNVLKGRTKNILLIGGGRISYYLASQLLEYGLYVKIIDKDLSRCQVLSEALSDAVIICGEGTNQKLLMSEGLKSVDALVALTGMDETNIIISTFAKEYTNGKIISKVNNADYSLILDRIGLDSVVSPKEISSTNIIRYVRAMESSVGSEFKTLYRFVDNKVEALEFYISSETDYTSVPIKDLKFKPNTIVGCIIRGNRVIIPQGKDSIEAKDSIIIFTTNQQIKDVKDILR